MYAALRHLRCAPGKSREVAEIIDAEYVPLVREMDGALSFTLIHLGTDEFNSLGLFSTEAAALRANDLAVAWATERLASLIASRPEASNGAVFLHHRFD